VVSFQVLEELKGKRVRVRVLVKSEILQAFMVLNPNQIEIHP